MVAYRRPMEILGSKQVNIHVSPRFLTEGLEEEAYG